MCDHHSKYVHLDIDLSRFKLAYCSGDQIIFTHILDPDPESRSNYAILYSDGGWMNNNLRVTLYHNNISIGGDLQLDEALMMLDDLFKDKP